MQQVNLKPVFPHFEGKFAFNKLYLDMWGLVDDGTFYEPIQDIQHGRINVKYFKSRESYETNNSKTCREANR